MVGWNVSRHPEWDMMFLAGLTAREIADRCKHNIATVHLHLNTREKYEPGFYRKHIDALETRGQYRVTTQWRKRMREAQYFYSTHGRLPRHAGDSSEHSLAVWIAEQRRLYELDELPQAKLSMLQPLTNWNVNPRTQEREMRWRKNLVLFIDFVATEHRMPRYRTYLSSEEHTLGVWLHNQHQRRTQHRLELWKLEELNKAVPAWRSRA